VFSFPPAESPLDWDNNGSAAEWELLFLLLLFPFLVIPLGADEVAAVSDVVGFSLLASYVSR